MTTRSAVAVLDTSDVHVDRIGISTVMFDYWALLKPEITFLVAITTGAAFWVGAAATRPYLPWIRLLQSLLGTILVAGGAATLNQLIEMPYDARMRRTARRPLASGRMAVGSSRVDLQACKLEYSIVSPK